MSDKCDRNSEEKQTTPLELGWFARASNGEIQTEQGERIPVGEITRVSTNTKTRKPHVQKFPRESCKSRISLTGQQIKTFKSVNWDLKEPVVFKGWVQESKDFHLPFRSQPSSSTRARHAVCSIPWNMKCNPLQYSCQENSTDRGAWLATVYGVAKSQTWLSN